MHRAPFHIVLYEPVIPQNTGSIARLCACTGARLHLIHPLGFQVDAAAVRRAGLDYWDHVGVEEHESWEAFEAKEKPEHLYLLTKFATQSFFAARIEAPAYLVLGSETKGLPPFLHERYAKSLYKIPMRTHLVRSLNLAQCAAVAVYEGMRQVGYTIPEGP